MSVRKQGNSIKFYHVMWFITLRLTYLMLVSTYCLCNILYFSERQEEELAYCNKIMVIFEKNLYLYFELTVLKSLSST